jgi:phospholipase C
MRRPAIAALAACLAAAALAAPTAGAQQDRRPPTRTPIKHFVVLMQENHSFDNYFGTYPGADGLPEGTCMPYFPRGADPALARRLHAGPGGVGAALGGAAVADAGHRRRGSSRCVKPYRLGGRSVDLPHTRQVHRLQYNRGRMDGFLDALRKEGLGPDPAVMGYYDERDLPFYRNVADRYVLFDRFFQSAAAGTLPNHMFWLTGTVGIPNRGDIPAQGFGDLPTIFDRLEARGISWKFYIEDYDPRINFRTAKASPQPRWAPLLGYARYIDDPKLNRHIVDLDEYYVDLQRGTLPAVAYIAPHGESEHPPQRLLGGQRFTGSLINALMQSPRWKDSAFMWSYDDWGGWYDHVPPPQVDRFGFGFRVPALLVSAYAKRGHVDSTTLDFTSMLKFIEYNWGVRPLAIRDRRANNLTSAFDFSQPPRPARLISYQRGAKAKEAPPEPRRDLIYVAYGSAFGAVALLVVLAALLQPWRGRRPPRGPGEPHPAPEGAPPMELEPYVGSGTARLLQPTKGGPPARPMLRPARDESHPLAGRASLGPALALVGACAALFGALFAAPELTRDDGPDTANPAPSAPPTETPPAPSAGGPRPLAGAARLPHLRERPRAKSRRRPKPPPRSPAPAAQEPQPVSNPAPKPVAPPPEPVAPPPEPVAPTREPVVPTPPPQPVTPAPPTSNPAPRPSPPPDQPAAPIHFFDSGG